MASSHTDAALAAAVATARGLGLRVGEPVVLKDGCSLLVHLRPAPVVARVATGTGLVRDGDGWLAREVAVARFLADAGEAVVAPSRELPPGPHHRDGFALSFWEHVPATAAGLPDAYEAGRRLRSCHAALLGFPGELPRMGALEEARAIVERLSAHSFATPADLDLLRATGDRAAARVAALDLPLQPIHGDAHLHNVIQTAERPMWNDWEDAFLGPTAWDLACLYAPLPPFGTHDPARAGQAYRGYGAPVHADILRALVGARRFQMLVWGIVLAMGRPEQRAWVDEQLAWLRAHTRP
ncbi:MAG TPA: aminoglycoside phosphotransferase family protein [Conexibacter sp.]|jgi:hypothetical protein